MLHLPDLCPGQRASQDRTDVTEVEYPGTQWKNTEYHSDYTEWLVPEHITYHEKSNTGDYAKSSTGLAIYES